MWYVVEYDLGATHGARSVICVQVKLCRPCVSCWTLRCNDQCWLVIVSYQGRWLAARVAPQPLRPRESPRDQDRFATHESASRCASARPAKLLVGWVPEALGVACYLVGQDAAMSCKGSPCGNSSCCGGALLRPRSEDRAKDSETILSCALAVAYVDALW